MSVFGIYSKFYDLIYQDKNYRTEVDYVEKLIQYYMPDARTIIDFGCGTGRHASIFAERGYIIHGIERSKEMLEQAKKKENGKNLRFTIGDIRSIRLSEIFDIVLSLFHVMSYQTKNEDIIMTFKTAAEHLRRGGLFIFDCWYGPAVLNEMPTIKVKRFEDEEIKMTRIAEPILNDNDNTVNINYSFFIIDKNTNLVVEFQEVHKVRYFFVPEVKMMFELSGFKLIDYYAFMTDIKPSINNWNVCFLGKKK